MNERIGSPDKHSRVDGYMGSSNMMQSLKMESGFSGLVDAKGPLKAMYSHKDVQRPDWKPKS